MDYKEHISRVLAYIEANLPADLRLTDLAREAGYSEYYFVRVFKEVTGLTPADYIRKRRLTEIVRDMERSDRPVSDIAFAWGFNSKENFTRAFQSEHRIAPSEYKAAKSNLKLYDPFRLETPPFSATPAFVTLKEFTLTALASDEDCPPNFWSKYSRCHFSRRLSGGRICEDVGVGLWNARRNRLDYWIGIRSEEALGDTTGAVQLEIPGGLYAVFETPPATQFDFVDTVHQTWNYMTRTWLTGNGYRRGDGPMFETYTKTSHAFSEKIYIPTERKDTA